MPTKAPKTITNQRKLHRSSTDSVLAGVAGGLGNYFAIDATLIRLAFILITVFGGSGVFLYLILWLVIPGSDRKGDFTEETIKVNATEIQGKAELLIDEVKDHAPRLRPFFNYSWTLIGLGVLFLANNFGVFNFFRWAIWWPVIIIGLGLFLLAKKDK